MAFQVNPLHVFSSISLSQRLAWKFLQHRWKGEVTSAQSLLLSHTVTGRADAEMDGDTASRYRNDDTAVIGRHLAGLMRDLKVLRSETAPLQHNTPPNI